MSPQITHTQTDRFVVVIPIIGVMLNVQWNRSLANTRDYDANRNRIPTQYNDSPLS